jgi:hypothetical protein
MGTFLKGLDSNSLPLALALGRLASNLSKINQNPLPFKLKSVIAQNRDSLNK